jgi:hypothetical protein
MQANSRLRTPEWEVASWQLRFSQITSERRSFQLINAKEVLRGKVDCDKNDSEERSSLLQTLLRCSTPF